MKLYIFDFDGTLFGSPPPPADFTKRMGDWWTHVMSLSEPCVPLHPGPEWWNTSMVNLARESIVDPDIYTVLLTGRPNNNAALRYRVAELLGLAGLDFDEIHLKTGENTDDFKAWKIKDLLRRHPEFEEVHMWDDRAHHLPKFADAAESMGVAAFPNPVTRFELEPGCTYSEILAMKESKMSLRQILIENEERRVPMDMDLPADLLEIHKRLSRWGDLFVVGGAVRDTLLGKTPKDYDLATNLPPDKVINFLRGQMGLKIDLTGKDFGVVRVWTPEGNEYEIATFREDVGSGRRPDKVKWATIEDDVKRRDLTINALFYDIDSGEIVDLVGGIDDLENGVIRAVGDPSQRFEEDPLRTLRAIRFAARMGSDLDPQTAEAVASVAAGSLPGVSADRVQDEFVKGLKTAQDPAQYVSLASSLGLMSHVFPGLRTNTPVRLFGDIPVQVATLVMGNDPGQTSKVLKQMRFKSAIVDTVNFLQHLAEISPDSVVTLKKLKSRFKIPDDTVQEFVDVTQLPHLEPRVVDAFLRFAAAPPAANPRDLMAQGLKGPAIGQAMADAEKASFVDLLGEARVKEIIREEVASFFKPLF